MDVAEVIRISNQAPAREHSQAGPGVGGHCIPDRSVVPGGRLPRNGNFIRLALDQRGHAWYVLHRANEVMAEHLNRDASGHLRPDLQGGR